MKKMKRIILLYIICLSSISIFAQNGNDNERNIYIRKTTFYGDFILEFIVTENGRTIYNPSFKIEYNSKRLKKIVKTGFLPCINCEVSYISNGNIYVDREYYTTENFNNYLAEKFKANEEASFWNRTSLTKEVYQMACPNFFEMTNEERLEYFLKHVAK